VTRRSRAKRLRILVLFEVHEPPSGDEEYERRMTEEEDWLTEGHVVATLRENGHEVHFGPLHEHPRELLAHLDRVTPDLVWNFVETFHGSRYYESNVAGILELCKVPYTGCGFRALMICQDKALSKKILKHHRVAVPPFVVSRRAQPLRKLKNAVYPLIVKPLAEEGSVGIAKDSFAENEEQALSRAAFLHERFRQDVIIERYIEGRELYAAVLGNERVKVFPPRELVFTKVPEGEPRYASYKAKWDPDYRQRWGIDNVFAEDLSEPALREIVAVAKRVYRQLQMRGFGRIDMRLTPEGKLFVVEANPNPEIAMYEDYSEAAARGGFAYNDLIERIVELALKVKFP
jgi:D-alanine-D-alanine ligase